MICPVCSHENNENARFCENCGTRLSGRSRVLDSVSAVSSSESGERRQLTILFSDVVGSTELSSSLDPEDFHDLIISYHRIAAAAVERFGGQVAQYQGDGVIALFGFPQAHEDDAERAVRAGLQLLEDMENLNKELAPVLGQGLQVRIGIHTGLIVVGADEETPWFYGDTANYASRVQGAAEPDTVVMSEATHELVAGFFIVEDRGLHVLKGVPRPMRLYRALQPSGVHGRLHASDEANMTFFVGREEERQLLLDRWHKAQSGQAQLVMVTGEAGIGKSRLLQQFQVDLAGTPHTWVEGGTSSYEQNTPFAPTIDMLRQAFQWSSETTPEKQVDDLEAGFAFISIDANPGVPLIASLLGLAIPDKYPPLLLSPEQQRVKLIETLVDWSLGLSAVQPLVLVIEDLHWADPSTLEELVHLAERSKDFPVLLIFTTRPDARFEWPETARLTQFKLKPLTDEQVAGMVKGLISQGDQTEDIIKLVNERTDGVPLYVEELTKAILESDSGGNGTDHIPATLQDLLMARLDRLGEAREIAQIGAVLGREFSYTLLNEVASVEDQDKDLDLLMETLVDADVMLVEGQGQDRTYSFRHALVQDSAYRSLLRRKRRELHLLTADTITSHFSEMASSRPEVLANHLTEGGEFERAVEAWKEAAESASGRWALAEAEHLYRKGLDVLQELQDPDLAVRLELPLQLSLGQILEATQGFGTQEPERIFGRARDIARQLGDDPAFLLALLGLWAALDTRSEIAAAQAISGELMELAEKAGMPMILVWAHMTQAMSSYMIPDLAQVERHVEQLLEFYEPDQHSWAPFDPKVSVLTHGALTHWHQGRIKRSRELALMQGDAAIGLSPSNQAMAALGNCSLYVYLREPEALLESAQRMMELGDSQALPSFNAWGPIYKALALIKLGDHQAGIDLLQQGIGIYLSLGTRSSLGWYLGMLAEALAADDRLDEALSTIEDAFGAAPEEKVHYPQLNQIRGDLLALRAEAGEGEEDRQEWLEAAEASYREAIELAQGYHEHMIELRATTGLARLLVKTGQNDEALDQLGSLMASFDEGEDSADLHDAADLLATLKAGRGVEL